MAPRAGEPAFDRRKGLRPNAQESPLPRDPALDQAGLLQYSQMSRYGRHADRERLRYLAARESLRLEQPFDNGASDRVGERGEDKMNALGRGGRAARFVFNVAIN